MLEKIQDNASANKRIARNSIFMSVRMIIVLLISLYTTRAILFALGVEDYGIYNVVCGFVSMFAFLNSSMTSATQRFYNYELGKNGKDGVRKVYNASFIIHFILAVAIVIITEVFGLWYLENKLVIPDARMTAAFWIFQFSVVSMFLNIINVPYSSVIMAYERMDYYAYVGIVEAILKLVIVYILYAVDTDKMILYGGLFLLIMFFDFLAYRIYAKHNFKELQLGLKPSWCFFRDMLSFASWNLFGSFAYMMREQGVNLLLNAYFGPVVNAAKGVANQVNGALNGFAGNLLIPARPQIIQSYAQGDIKRSFRLMYSVSKLTCIIFLFMSLPICFLISPILKIWLGANVPDHAASFIIVLLITSTWGTLVAPVSSIVHATGKMKFYQILSSSSNVLTVPLAYILLVVSPVPEYVFIALFITMLTNHLAGLISLVRITSFSIIEYTKKVVLPLFMVICLSVMTTAITYFAIYCQIWRFCLVSIVSIISVTTFSFVIALDTEEKKMLKQLINKITNR